MTVRPHYEKPDQYNCEDTKAMSLSEVAEAVKGGHFRDILRPSFKSCCEEAQLTANELARRNKELAEANDEITELSWAKWTLIAERNAMQRCADDWRVRAEKAEAERDEWKRNAANALQERNLSWKAEARLTAERDEWKASAEATAKDYSGAESRVSKLIAERDELQADLDAAENRPTLDRETVREVIGKHCGALGGYYMNLLVNDLMALTEQAATGDEEQRAKAFFLRMVGPGLVEGTWESLPAQYREWFTTTVPDDWTPPESEVDQ